MRDFVFENKGAGLYGAPAPTHKTKCPNSNNPHGHSDQCPCRTAPVADHVDAPAEVVFPPSRHESLFAPEIDPDYAHDMEREREVFGDW